MNQLEVCGASALLVIFISVIIAGYLLHMWHVLRDIAQEDAEREANRLFRDYTENCEYRVHVQMRIVDEMGVKR